VTSASLKKSLTGAFCGAGFSRFGTALRREGEAVTAVVAFSRGFGNQRFINVGFWLHALGPDVPAAVEKTHLYFRLDRLAPEWREVILVAGCLDDKRQPDALSQLGELLTGEVEAVLHSLLSVQGLKAAVPVLEVSGLVSLAARDYLVAVAE
jgi:hypothetical protein